MFRYYMVCRYLKLSLAQQPFDQHTSLDLSFISMDAVDSETICDLLPDLLARTRFLLEILPRLISIR